MCALSVQSLVNQHAILTIIEDPETLETHWEFLQLALLLYLTRFDRFHLS